MAKTYISPYVTVNSVDLSDHVAAVTIPEEVDALETTAGGDTVRQHVGGLKKVEITLDLHNDYAASNVYHTISDLIGSTTNVVVQPRSGSATTTNPQWTCVALITEFSDIEGSVGDLDEYSVTWPVNSITEALS